VDGLNDYDDDYLTGSYGQGPISTTYQVGKGMLSHLLEMERQKEALLSQIEEDATSEVSEEHLDSEEQEGLTVTQIDAMLPLESEIEMQEAEPMMPTPRRMTFHFEDDTP
jgi:hypothetical protein